MSRIESGCRHYVCENFILHRGYNTAMKNKRSARMRTDAVRKMLTCLWKKQDMSTRIRRARLASESWINHRSAWTSRYFARDFRVKTSITAVYHTADPPETRSFLRVLRRKVPAQNPGYWGRMSCNHCLSMVFWAGTPKGRWKTHSLVLQ